MKGRNIHSSTRESHSLRSTEISEAHKVGLPKIDLKSPARVIEEKELSPKGEDVPSQRSTRATGDDITNDEVAYERRVRQGSSSTPPNFDRQKRILKENDVKEGLTSPLPTQDQRQVSDTVTISHSIVAQRRNSCGTPASVKSKVRTLIILNMKGFNEIFTT